MAKPPSDDFIAKVDEAAAAILARAGGSVTVPSAGDGGGTEAPGVPVSLKDQVEAFSVVAKWAETRSRLLKPEAGEPKPSGGKFDGIRGRFNGSAPSRSGPRPRADDDSGEPTFDD